MCETLLAVSISKPVVKYITKAEIRLIEYHKKISAVNF